MMRIAVLDDYQSVAMTYADWSAPLKTCTVEVFSDHLMDEAALVERLRPFDAICLLRERTPIPRRVLEQLPNLKFINTTGRNNASLDSAAARELGILIGTTTGGANGAPELTWALILAAARHIPTETTTFRNGGWQTTIGSDLAGSTLGIIGLGKIGRQMATVGSAFGMNVIAWSQNLTEEHAASIGVRRVDKATLWQKSDWVTLHLVLSDRSRGIIGASELAMMKPSAWLVNTSRGPLVDEMALICALENRQIAGAALDVFDEEPICVTHPLRRLSNVIATPHIGFVTENTYRRFFTETVENIGRWLGGDQFA